MNNINKLCFSQFYSKISCVYLHSWYSLCSIHRCIHFAKIANDPIAKVFHLQLNQLNHLQLNQKSWPILEARHFVDAGLTLPYCRNIMSQNCLITNCCAVELTFEKLVWKWVRIHSAE